MNDYSKLTRKDVQEMLFRFKTLQKFSEKGEHWAAVPGFKGDLRFSSYRRLILLDSKNRVKKIFKMSENADHEMVFDFRLDGRHWMLNVEQLRKDLFPTIVAAEQAEAKAAAARQARKAAVSAGATVPFQGVPIECVEDGRRFETMSECADAYGITRHRLRSSLQNQNGYVPAIDRTFRKIT